MKTKKQDDVVKALEDTVPDELKPSNGTLAPITALGFKTSPDSPFPDKYSIELERKELAGAIDDPDFDVGHPLYDRVVMLEEREAELKRLAGDYSERAGAESVVPVSQSQKIRWLGKLEDETPDEMVLHTKEAFRLFLGRSSDPIKKTPPIPGGMRIASCLRTLWMLTATDNPYADWALVRHEMAMKEIFAKLAQEVGSAQAKLRSLEEQGLVYRVIKSVDPKALELGFKSPYGYSIAELVVRFDFFVRIQKTMQRKNMVNDQESRSAIAAVLRVIRRHFNEVSRFERWLNRKELRQIGRADFVPAADGDASKRVESASAIFGVIPADIYSRKIAPSHTRRRLELSPSEIRLLEDVSKGLAQAEAQLEGAVAQAEASGELL